MNEFMKLAYNEAKKAYQKGEVPVGVVIVKNNEVVAKAHNLRETKNSSLAHAELLAIEKACKKNNSWRLDGAEMYVTLEPCLMCTGAIIQSRIKKVYIGAKDEKNGYAHLLDSNATYKVKYEYLDECECCSNIITEFFKDLRKTKEK